MKTNREKAIELLDKLTNKGDGITDRALLEYIIYDYMDGSEAYETMLAAQNEFFETDEYSDDGFDWERDEDKDQAYKIFKLIFTLLKKENIN